jgi:hypothetical protein
MRLTGLLFAAAAALSMIAAPALADPANPAAKLSLTNSNVDNGAAGSSNNVRAGAKLKRSSKFAFTAPVIILGVAAAGGIIAGAVISSQSDNKPASA